MTKEQLIAKLRTGAFGTHPADSLLRQEGNSYRRISDGAVFQDIGEARAYASRTKQEGGTAPQETGSLDDVASYAETYALYNQQLTGAPAERQAEDDPGDEEWTLEQVYAHLDQQRRRTVLPRDMVAAAQRRQRRAADQHDVAHADDGARDEAYHFMQGIFNQAGGADREEAARGLAFAKLTA